MGRIEHRKHNPELFVLLFEAVVVFPKDIIAFWRDVLPKALIDKLAIPTAIVKLALYVAVVVAGVYSYFAHES